MNTAQFVNKCVTALLGKEFIKMSEIKEENLRSSMFGRMHLTPKNETIAQAYLNMEQEEDTALLSELEQQDLMDIFPINGYLCKRKLRTFGLTTKANHLPLLLFLH